MNTRQITIDFPFDILLAINETEDELKLRIKIELAVRLYRQNKITIGKAAQITGLPRVKFESILSNNKIPISNLTFDDVIADSKKLK